MSVWVVFVAVGLLIVLNSISFGMFAWDKWCSQNNRLRISEASLLFVALIGGSAGAISAQQLLRHKTRKQPFRSVLWGIAAVQVVALVVLTVPTVRKAIIPGVAGAYRANCVESFVEAESWSWFMSCLGRA